MIPRPRTQALIAENRRLLAERERLLVELAAFQLPSDPDPYSVTGYMDDERLRVLRDQPRRRLGCSVFTLGAFVAGLAFWAAVGWVVGWWG